MTTKMVVATKIGESPRIDGRGAGSLIENNERKGKGKEGETKRTMQTEGNHSWREARGERFYLTWYGKRVSGESS